MRVEQVPQERMEESASIYIYLSQLHVRILNVSGNRVTETNWDSTSIADPMYTMTTNQAEITCRTTFGC